MKNVCSNYMKNSTYRTFDIAIGKTGSVHVTLINEKRRTAAAKVSSSQSIEIRAPKSFGVREAKEWLSDIKLSAKLAGLIEKKRNEEYLASERRVGGYFFFLGEKLPIIASQNGTYAVSDSALLVPSCADSADITDHIFGFYAESAKDLLPSITHRFAEMKGVHVSKIMVKRNRSRWGSCSSRASISFTDSLMAYPLSVIEYVALHEVCHLLHMDHSHEFWTEVADIMPDYKQRRDALRVTLAPRE